MNEKNFNLVKGCLSKRDRSTHNAEDLTAEELLMRTRITPALVLPPMQPLFQMFGTPCFYRGELVAACGGKKVAVVAYKGAAGTADTSTSPDASGYVGLAIALKDANDGNRCPWYNKKEGACLPQTRYYSNALESNFGKGIEFTNTLAGGCGASHVHAAARAAKDYKYDASVAAGAHPTGTSQWFLPTIYQWNRIVKGMCGDHGDLSVTDKDDYKYDKFNTKVTAAGGTGVQNFTYFSSTEDANVAVWGMDFNRGKVIGLYKYNDFYVRAVLAF